jgi:dTDP-4-dehydrorhamnose reductase
VKVDDAETDLKDCYTSNTLGAHFLAIACKKHNIKLLTFSSDLVFDGSKQEPYVESDKARPLNIYGKSKAHAESLILHTNPSALIIRTSAFFGPWDQYNFAYHVLRSLNAYKEFIAADDVIISPTYVPHLVHSALDLLIDDEKGIWHLANAGEITWYELAKEVAQRAGYNEDLIIPQSLHSMQLPAKRPFYSVLKSERGLLMPPLDHAINCFLNERSVEFA